MGLNIKKLVSLTEQSGPDFRGQWQEQLGIITDEKTGRKHLDKGKAGVDARNVDFTELDREFGSKLGERSFVEWREQHFQEAQVLPSTFAHISGWDMTIAGLLDAMVLEGYQSLEFLGKGLIGTQQIRTMGGKKIRVANDGQIMGEVPIGIPLPEVGLKENWITLPTPVRRGNALSINKLDFLLDRTGVIQERAVNAGYAVGYQTEQAIIDVVFGITNPYSMNDTTGNTYLTTNGTNPMNYTNAKEISAAGILDWRDINTAHMVLAANTDPNTGFPIAITTPKLYCMPQVYLDVRSKLFPTGGFTGYNAAIASATIRQNYENPLPWLGMDSVIPLNFIWFNRWSALGAQDSAKAPYDYLLGDPTRAFKWLEIQPFTTWTAPITTYEMKRGIAAVHMTEEVGIPAVIEPRYIYRSKKTS